ncbi:MG2 domain-containing protein [Burkholderia multivorans]|uniref:alpha-2-macroglobulin family protein n=1 Tax=Burkholderia multivorans TaxID=87883 RepID=UPI0020191B52|nr:MG2 domain-containing protein [Burkholderia multivorans]MCL4657783.1 MG2 domain-containing protein [Burkholderia multivorans]UQN55716.1 MG2 domain-containing protein [Burkholderia multivorans]UQN81256.1 MG2 domain-containing protein [Burkholderia multivorans]
MKQRKHDNKPERIHHPDRARRLWQAGALAALAGAAALSLHAGAARTVSVSPQGTVTEVRQAVVKFDEAMVAFGSASAPHPARVSCTDAAAARGQGHWLDDKTWVYDFENDLPPGVRCAVALNDTLRSVAGNALGRPHRFAFQTGGPFPVSVRPGAREIEERQVFVLKLNGPADERSALANIWCEAAGIGNRIPVAAADGATRAALLDHFGWKRDAARVLTLQCAQALPASAKMQLVYGKGVASPSGIANETERRFDFTVRAPFAASFSCERENANAPCTPLRPLTLTFNAPIARKDAEAIRLRGPDGALSPTFAADDRSDEVTTVTFAAPLPAQAALTIELPTRLHDVTDRPLANADLFPLATRTAPMPPLAKFSSGTFGIVERFAEPDTPALVPVTLRNVEADLHVAGLNAGDAQFSNLKVDDDTAIREWMRNVERFDNWAMTAGAIDERMPGLLTRKGQHPVYVPLAAGERMPAPKDRRIDVRSLSLLGGERGVQTLTLPKADPKTLRPFEVVGVPIDKPGFYVLELASPALGRSLLAKPSTMYVRTAVLVTNLGVHLKQGRDNNLVWVTTLDKGKPVPNAQIRVSDCNGDEIAAGKTDAQGLLKIDGPFEPKRECRSSETFNDYFVSARVDDPKTGRDMAFVSSNWNRGIEAWRFNVPTDTDHAPTVRAHTVFDRTLLRAGETVSMKHFVRTETLQSLAFPSQYPTRVTIRHLGSGQTYKLPLTWAADHSADTQFALPAAAKLGEYSVELEDGPDDAPTSSIYSGSFRVEAFRLPVLKGTIGARDAQTSPLVAAKEAPLAVQIDYVSGGGASNLPVQVSALMKWASPPFADRFEDFSFTPYRPDTGDGMADDDEQDDDDRSSANGDPDATKLIADKLPLTLDRNGAGAITLKGLPAIDAPKRIALEATFADPNGEVQTIRGDTMLWPAAVVTGIKAGRWVSVGQRVPVQALAVDLQGKPRASVPIEIKGVARITTSSRKRMVGGFYAYDNKSDTRDLGVLCSGKTDDKGRMACDATLEQAGNVQLIAVAKDGDGRTSNASTSVWVTREDELWFGGDNTDRIDVIPEKTAYEPGETARFQVRMPFRYATALVAVERGGVMETHVVELNGKNPTVDLKVDASWGPNVYVSVLALRGRIREVPWYSFFTWGWKAPVEWARAFWREGRHYEAPTAFVDLSKPAFRYGLGEIKVGTGVHRLGVTVTTDATRYTVRGTARAQVKVTLPNGQPAPAGTQIAVAAVDEALLELMPNASWDLLDAMLRRRAYGIETATAQMEIVGRRHFGRKAVPAGGGGGSAPTRELFDTLLLWNPRVTLDANGSATVNVPLNDALTRFRIVAIAAVGADRFGTGSTSIRSTQDLQLISGLPPLVREGDAFRAQITLRNTTDRAMQVAVTPRVTGLDLAPQTVSIAANAAAEVGWTVTVPEQALDATGALNWRIEAAEQGGKRASDALAVAQKVVPALPVTVQQATLAQVDGTLTVPVSAPAGAVVNAQGAPRGGIAVSLQSKLADGLPGVRRWFERYPYRCLEQQTSRAIGLRDAAQWQALVARMPVYLDGDGLASYFPPASDDAHSGSPTLSSYLLVVSDEAGRLDPRFALPEDLRTQLEAGLARFVDGRIERNSWAPRQDRDLRKLAAIEALSRYGAAQARMLGSIEIAPNQWPTSALIDYHAILTRVKDIAQRDEKRAQVEQILRARLTYQGTQLVFSTARDDDLWWLMTSNETNAARLALEFAGDPAWKDEMPRVTAGLLALQRQGAWQTTTSNALGLLAVERFSRTYESAPVAGTTKIALGDNERTIAWSQPPAAADAPASATAATRAAAARSVLMPWPRTSQAPATLSVTQDGTGRPWATVESLAAVPLRAPFAAGYRITKTVTPVQPAVSGVLTRGDVVRVHLDIDAQSDMTWVVVNDPIPSGATILGSGLGRDSEVATQDEKRPDGAWPAFVERDFDGYRAYYDYLPKGKFSVEYTVRLNNVGTFGLPPTRVEALYAPSVYGLWPNPPVTVKPAAASRP